MKRMWICIAILAGLFLGATGNSICLHRFTDEMTETLTQAQEAVTGGDWETARELTRQAQEYWNAHDGYLYTVLRHCDADGVSISFQEVQQLLEWEEAPEYSATNSRLIRELELLVDMEELNLKNLL